MASAVHVQATSLVYLNLCYRVLIVNTLKYLRRLLGRNRNDQNNIFVSIYGKQ